MFYYYKRKKLNKYGVMLMVPYLLMMAISFDIIFLGDKLNLMIEYKELFKKPILFQFDVLKYLGIFDVLEKNLSFYKIYILTTCLNSIIIYNIGRVVSKKFNLN